MKMTPNSMDEGMVEDVGMLNMQLAIQRVAAAKQTSISSPDPGRRCRTNGRGI